MVVPTRFVFVISPDNEEDGIIKAVRSMERFFAEMRPMWLFKGANISMRLGLSGWRFAYEELEKPCSK
jgi:hypothetical protein